MWCSLLPIFWVLLVAAGQLGKLTLLQLTILCSEVVNMRRGIVMFVLTLKKRSHPSRVRDSSCNSLGTRYSLFMLLQFGLYFVFPFQVFPSAMRYREVSFMTIMLFSREFYSKYFLRPKLRIPCLMGIKFYESNYGGVLLIKFE